MGKDEEPHHPATNTGDSMNNAAAPIPKIGVTQSPAAFTYRLF